MLRDLLPSLDIFSLQATDTLNDSPYYEWYSKIIFFPLKWESRHFRMKNLCFIHWHVLIFHCNVCFLLTAFYFFMISFFSGGAFSWYLSNLFFLPFSMSEKDYPAAFAGHLLKYALVLNAILVFILNITNFPYQVKRSFNYLKGKVQITANKMTPSSCWLVIFFRA